MNARELYSIEDARFLLGGIARKTIYDLLNNGDLSSVVIGRRRFISRAAVAAFIATSSTQTAPSERRATGKHRAIQIPLQLEPPAAKHSRRRLVPLR
jgi:excisionase family DNA binding protein